MGVLLIPQERNLFEKKVSRNNFEEAFISIEGDGFNRFNENEDEFEESTLSLHEEEHC